MPETGFRRRPRAERASALGELRTTAIGGARFAWAQPVILLLVGVELFIGMSSEAFDRLKEAHFLRDIGLPAVGDLDPVIWFGIFWLAGMVLGLSAMGRLIKRAGAGGRRARDCACTRAVRPGDRPPRPGARAGRASRGGCRLTAFVGDAASGAGASGAFLF